ncbi:MAG TPA: hypothetical protein VIG24_08940 [Acidimicrobiia bacterium]
MGRFWIIAHRTNGTVLPAPMGRGGRGGTHVEPVSEDGPWSPRLFHSHAAAKVALHWWLSGKITVSTGQDYWGEYDESWHTEPAPERKKEDWHVVPVRIVREATNG